MLLRNYKKSRCRNHTLKKKKKMITIINVRKRSRMAVVSIIWLQLGTRLQNHMESSGTPYHCSKYISVATNGISPDNTVLEGPPMLKPIISLYLLITQYENHPSDI